MIVSDKGKIILATTTAIPVQPPFNLWLETIRLTLNIKR